MLPLFGFGQSLTAVTKSGPIKKVGLLNVDRKLSTPVGSNKNDSKKVAIKTFTPTAVKSPRRTSVLKEANKIESTVSYADSVVLYGFHYKKYDTSTLAPTVYSFHAAPAISFERESNDTIAGEPQTVIYGDGRYYVIYSPVTYDDYGNSTVNSTMNVLDAKTLKVVKENVALGTPMPLLFGNGTFDAASQKIYFYGWNADYDKVLYSLDLTTYELKSVATVKQYMSCLAASPDGYLYGLNPFDDCSLYKVDKTTGAATKVGATYGKLANNAVSMTAAIDYGTGKMYAVLMTSDWTTHLFCIDTTTGKTTQISDMPSSERMMGLFIPATTDKAPAPAQSIKFEAKSASALSGTLSFSVPSKTFDGKENLSGALTAYIDLDGTVEEKAVTVGQAFSEVVNLKHGLHVFNIQIGNAAGKSQERRFNVFTGVDLPGAADSVHLTVDEASRQASVIWCKPKTSQSGGVMDGSNISYRVIRMPQNVVVSENQKDTTFTENLGNERAKYYYEIVSMSGVEAGDTAVSNVVNTGTYLVPPFKETFDTEADAAGYYSYDVNNDGITWHYDTTFGTHTIYIGGSGADDYFVTPLVRLSTVSDYRLYFKAGCDGGGSHLTVMLGKDQKFTGKEKVIGSYDLSVVAPLSVAATMSYLASQIEVPETGDYYIGFHLTGNGNSYLDNIEVRPDALMTAPDAVSGLTITAGEKGALNNTVSFKAPTTTGTGKDLTSISKICIYKDLFETNAVKTFDNPTPGAQLTWTEDNLAQGIHAYTVRAYNDNGIGKVACDSDFVGLDAPMVPVTLTATMPENGVTKLQWNAVSAKGQNGGYVDVANTKYNVYRQDDTTKEWKAIATGVSGLTYMDKDYTMPAGQQQDNVQYAVCAVNATGTSEYVKTNITIGTPFEVPFKESFVDAELGTLPWVLHTVYGDASDENSSWTLQGRGGAVNPFDGDGGMLRFANLSSASLEATMQTPRVKLGDNSALSFFMYHGYEADAGDIVLNVYASADDADTVKIATLDYNDGTVGWNRHVIRLDQFKNSKNVTFYLRGYAGDGSAAIYLDNLVVDVFASKDLAVESYSIPVRVVVGDTAKLTALVRNYGIEDAANYSVNLYRNGSVVAMQSGKDLKANAAQSFSFDVVPTLTEAGTAYNYCVVAQFVGDTKNSNDSSLVVGLYVSGPKFPKVVNLAGAGNAGKVVLSWDKPNAEMPDAITDSFEDYQEFIIDSIGDWKVYDGDGYPTIYFNAPDVPHMFEPMAWWVWNSYDAGFHNTEVVKAHTGKQQLAAFSACGTNDEMDYIAYPNKNWLISPEVTPGTDVSFWVSEALAKYGPETFQFLYSSTDQNYKSFKVIGGGQVEMPGWIQYAFTLPEDAKYFAILHNTKKNGQLMFLDDVTYTPLYGSTTTLTLKGYNVYRDGKLVAENLSNPTYTDAAAGEANHTYQVSAVWSVGESMLSNAFTYDNPLGISDASNGAATVSVSGHNIVLYSATAQIGNVYTIDGKCVISTKVEGRVSVPVSAGMYVVTLGTRTVKLLVK
jgi:hypothetical protein